MFTAVFIPFFEKNLQPHGTGYFGRRHLWLDDMPPFTGTQSIQKTCRYLLPSGHKAGIQSHQLLQCQKSEAVCTCFMCNENLLKLQVTFAVDKCRTLKGGPKY